MRHARQNEGFALLLVMILVAAGVVLGMSYLSSASLRTDISRNYAGLARARYIAESGLEHALYVLRFAPEQLEGGGGLGPYHVDASDDSYSVVCAAGGSPGEYVVTSTASVGGVRRSCSATVLRRAGTQTQVQQAVFVGNGLTWLPWSFRLDGDIQVNGFLMNFADIRGNATTTGGLWDPWGRITGTADGSAEARQAPTYNVNDYLAYVIGPSACTAAEFTGQDLAHSDPLASGGAVTATNIGGVVHLKPASGSTVTLNRGLNFTGTLVIDGDVRLDGSDIVLNAVEGFPAIVATGSIQVTDNARNVVINGLVAAGGGIVAGSPVTSHSSVKINGCLVAGIRGVASGLEGDHRVIFDSERAQTYDLSISPELRSPTVTVIDWDD